MKRIALFLAAAIAAGGCSKQPGPPVMLQELRSGGVVLYMRHTIADETRTDTPPGDYLDCTWQRNLTEEGRQVAKDMGTSIAALQLPIESVIASPMCRTMDTARLAFGGARPEVALRGGPKLANGSIDLAPVKQFFTRRPSAGKIAVIVGHESPGMGFDPMLQQGETAVIRPGSESYSVIGRIPADQWSKWASGTANP